MKRTFLVLLSLAALTAACESSTSTPAPTTTTDTASGGDVSTTADTAAPTDTSGGTGDTATTTPDTTTTADTTTTQDTATGKDTVTPPPAKCDQSDNVCINTCSQKECKAEQEACSKDKNCFGLSTCLSGCAQGVSPPADVTGSTCEGKCLTLAGDAAAKLYDSFSGCAFDKCVVCTQGKPGYDQCVSNCALKQCVAEVEACSKAEGCGKILTCLEANKCQDQGCLIKCMNESDNDGKAAFQAIAQCVNNSKGLCE